MTARTNDHTSTQERQSNYIEDEGTIFSYYILTSFFYYTFPLCFIRFDRLCVCWLFWATDHLRCFRYFSFGSRPQRECTAWMQKAQKRSCIRRYQYHAAESKTAATSIAYTNAGNIAFVVLQPTPNTADAHCTYDIHIFTYTYTLRIQIQSVDMLYILVISKSISVCFGSLSSYWRDWHRAVLDSLLWSLSCTLNL